MALVKALALVALTAIACLGVTRVQVTGNAAGNTTVPMGGGTVTDSQAFSSNVTTGNTILAMFGGTATGTGAFWGASASCSDTRGNTYSLIFLVGSGDLDGGGIAACVAVNVTGGSDTVTVSYTAGSGAGASNYSTNMSIAEYVCKGCYVPASASGKIFGGPGNSPVVQTFTDSGRTSVNVTYTGTAGGTGGPGTICSLGVVDLVESTGANYLAAAVKTTTSVTITSIVGSSPYGAMSQQFTAMNVDNWFFFDGTTTSYAVGGSVGIL